MGAIDRFNIIILRGHVKGNKGKNSMGYGEGLPLWAMNDKL